MGRQNAIKVTKRAVDALAVESGDAVFWDRDLAGFEVKAYATRRKVYVVQTRGPGGSLKRATLGVHGEVAPDEVRKDAAAVIDRIRRGEEPFPPPETPEPTVAELAERYMTAHVYMNCHQKTVETFGRAVRLYIVPELGHLKLSEVDRSHVSDLHYKMRDKPAQANQTVGVLAKMFRLAEAWGMTPPWRNPCRSVRLYRKNRRERFLTPEEYRMLGRVLHEAETDGSVMPSAVAAVRLLLTGCRKNEIVTLRWDDIDRTAGEIRIRNAKAGARRVPPTSAVERVLAGIERVDGNLWVITGQNPRDHLKNLDQVWQRLRNRAKLGDVRIHDARRSFASRALAIGESLPTIGRLLGHRRLTTTARYAHLARDTEPASAVKVGGSIGTDILGNGETVREPVCGGPGEFPRKEGQMARFRKKTISRRTVEALEVEKDTIFWDRELTGFGVRAHLSGRKVYIVQTRERGKPAKRVTVGRHGVITAEEAHRRAALIVARIKAGGDPVPEPLAAKLAKGPTVGDLAARWLEEHVGTPCKRSTAETYRLTVPKHILPAFGRKPALAVEHKDVTDLHRSLRHTPFVANRVVDTLSPIYNAAEDRELIPEASNPCRLVMLNGYPHSVTHSPFVRH